MVSLTTGLGSKFGTQVPLHDKYKNPNKLLVNADGLIGVDCLGLGRNWTRWSEIDKIVVTNEKLTFVSRLPGDINKSYNDYDNYQYVIENTYPEDITEENNRVIETTFDLDTTDERCVSYWRDIQAALTLYMRQKGRVAKLKDGTNVHKTQIPTVELNHHLSEEDDWRIEGEVNVPGTITALVIRVFAPFEEYAAEIEKGKTIDIYTGKVWSVKRYDPKRKVNSDQVGG
jgi:hypothetical protein